METRVIALGVIGVGLVTWGIVSLMRLGKAGEIVDFLWSPEKEAWNSLDGATLQLCDPYVCDAFFVSLRWKNKLDRDAYCYVELKGAGPDAKLSWEGMSYALANDEAFLVATWSGGPGSHAISVTIRELENEWADPGDIMDEATIHFEIAYRI